MFIDHSVDYEKEEKRKNILDYTGYNFTDTLIKEIQEGKADKRQPKKNASIGIDQLLFELGVRNVIKSPVEQLTFDIENLRKNDQEKANAAIANDLAIVNDAEAKNISPKDTIYIHKGEDSKDVLIKDKKEHMKRATKESQQDTVTKKRSSRRKVLLKNQEKSNESIAIIKDQTKDDEGKSTSFLSRPYVKIIVTGLLFLGLLVAVGLKFVA